MQVSVTGFFSKPKFCIKNFISLSCYVLAAVCLINSRLSHDTLHRISKTNIFLYAVKYIKFPCIEYLLIYSEILDVLGESGVFQNMNNSRGTTYRMTV